MTKEKRLGIFGFGEAGQLIVEGLITDGYPKDKIKAYDINYQGLLKKANELEINLYNDLDAFLKDLDFLIVLVPCSLVLKVALEILEKISPNCIYLDLSTSFPQDQKEIEKLSRQYHITYCDGSILGSLPKFKHRVPILISGKGTEQIKEYLIQWNMNITIVGEEAGRASAIKLCRSIYTKGTQALLVELVKATEYFGITDIVFDSIEKTWYLDGFINEADRQINSTRTHFQRRKDEIDYTIKMLEKIGIPAYMCKSASKVFEVLEDEYTK